MRQALKTFLVALLIYHTIANYCWLKYVLGVEQQCSSYQKED